MLVFGTDTDSNKGFVCLGTDYSDAGGFGVCVSVYGRVNEGDLEHNVHISIAESGGKR